MEEQLASGKDVILEIEVQGALKVKEKMFETLLLFVTPPSADELVHQVSREEAQNNQRSFNPDWNKLQEKQSTCRIMIIY